MFSTRKTLQELVVTAASTDASFASGGVAVATKTDAVLSSVSLVSATLIFSACVCLTDTAAHHFE